MSGSTFDTTKTPLQDILKRIQTGKMQLPDFQRGWVWEDERIRSLLASIAAAFPIGAVMLLEVGGKDIHFKPRPVEGTTVPSGTEPEILILDGQQRLTSLFQALLLQVPVQTMTQEKKKIQRYYYFDMRQMIVDDYDEETAIVAVPEDRRIKSDFGRKIELDVSTKTLEFERMLFPVNRVFDSADWRSGFQEYWNYDADKTRLFNEFERRIIKRFEQYQLPVIELDRAIPKEAVCAVFEKVNTGGVPLTVFELLTATFAADNFQLREDWEGRALRLRTKYKTLQGIQSDDFLQAITLLVTLQRRNRSVSNGVPEDRLPGIACKRRDILRLSVDDYRQWAEEVERGFGRVARFLFSQKIFRNDDLPYRTQLVPLAAAAVALGHEWETAGAQARIARWYWCGVLGELYGGAVESRFARDLPEVEAYVRSGSLEPKTIQDANFDANRLLTLKTRNSAAYKGIHALLMNEGCRDFRTGHEISNELFFDEAVDIHHIFPQAWCMKAGLAESRINSIVNKTALSARTNRIIGGQAPSSYLPRIRVEAGMTEETQVTVLQSHGIAPESILADNFDLFFRKRAGFLVALIQKAMDKPVSHAGADFLVAPDSEEYITGPEEWSEDGNGDKEPAPPLARTVDASAPADGDGSPAKIQPADQEQQFHQNLLDVYEETLRATGYHAARFLTMLSESGGLATARTLLGAKEISDGFVELWVRGRLDLTVEAQSLRPEFRSLFTPDERAIAHKRLAEVGYEVAP